MSKLPDNVKIVDLTGESIEPLFTKIGTDYAAAVRLNDTKRQRALVALTVALEYAYPVEMAVLRAVAGPRMVEIMPPPLNDAVTPGGVPEEAFAHSAHYYDTERNKPPKERAISEATRRFNEAKERAALVREDKT